MFCELVPDETERGVNMKLRRIAPGFYTTLDGEYEVHGFQRPTRDDYGPAGQWRWYWKPRLGEANDHFDTKREAVENLATAMKGFNTTHCGLGGRYED